MSQGKPTNFCDDLCSGRPSPVAPFYYCRHSKEGTRHSLVQAQEEGMDYFPSFKIMVYFVEGEIIMTLCELKFCWLLTYFGNDREACAGNIAGLQNCFHLWVFLRRYAFWFVLVCQYYLMANKYIKIQQWEVKCCFLVLFTNKNLL